MLLSQLQPMPFARLFNSASRPKDLIFGIVIGLVNAHGTRVVSGIAGFRGNEAKAGVIARPAGLGVFRPEFSRLLSAVHTFFTHDGHDHACRVGFRLAA
jgi:hypothetical protein